MQSNFFLLVASIIILAFCLNNHIVKGSFLKPQCSVHTEYNNTRIFTTYGEFFPYYISNYFDGYNLRYTINNGEELPYHFLKSGI